MRSPTTTGEPPHTKEPQPDPKPSALTVRLTAMTTAAMLIVNACGSGAPIEGSHRTGTGEPGVNGPPADQPGVNGPPTGSTPTGLAPNAVVERVVDGDTFTARIGGRSEYVRLLGIDTPESVARTRPVQCYGKEASLRLAELLPVGTEVTLVRDVEARDVYNRLLAYAVRSDDDLFVNLELVNEGYAAILDYPPNDHYTDVLQRAESAARAAGRGLWGVCGGPDVPLD